MWGPIVALREKKAVFSQVNLKKNKTNTRRIMALDKTDC